MTVKADIRAVNEKHTPFLFRLAKLLLLILKFCKGKSLAKRCKAAEGSSKKNKLNKSFNRYICRVTRLQKPKKQSKNIKLYFKYL